MKYLLLMLIFAVACCTHAAADLMDGLVLYMPFDEGTGTSTEDFSENGFTGEINGNAKWVDGKFGNALEFAAAADFVAVEDDAAFHIEDAITQAAWVNLTRLPSAHAIIFGTRSGGVGRHIGFGFGMDPANRLKVWTNGAGGGFVDVIDNATALDTGKWYYLAYTHTSANNGLVKIYVDGELTGAVETNNPVAPARTTNQLQIGTWSGEAWLGVGWIETWPGLVDEVRLWNRALSADEVKESMDVGMAGFLTASEPTPMELTSTALAQDPSLPEGAIARFENKAGRAGIDFSPTVGNLLAIGDFGRTYLWDTSSRTLQKTLEGHAGRVGGVSFSVDGRTLATMSGTEVYLWDVDSGDRLRDLSLPRIWGGFEACDFGPGNILASAHGNQIYLSDITFSEQPEIVKFPDDIIDAFTFGHDSTKIAAHSSINGNFGQRGLLYDTVSKQLHTFHEGGSSVWSEALDPHGNLVAYGRTDGTVNIWDIASLTQVKTFMAHTAVISLAFSPNGTLLASGSYGEVRLWHVVSGELLKTFTWPEDGPTEYLVFNNDGTQLASSSWDSLVLVWDVPTSTDLISSEPTPTESTSTDTVVSLKPAVVQSPAVGEELTVTLSIVNGENVAGYQANLIFDTTALRYVSGNYGAYLPAGSFHIPLSVDGNRVTLAATALAESRSGSGELASVTFEVLEVKASMLTLSQVSLVAPDGEKSAPRLENAQITPVEPDQILGDANRDGILNIQDLVLIASRFGETGENEADINEDNIVDIVDLVLAANEIGNAAAAPTLHPEQPATLEGLSAADVQQWLTQGVKAGIADPNYQQGILYLQHLMAALIPRATALLPNYPNPFNPETWIPYQLAKPAKTMVSIHAADGKLVRTLHLGELPAGVYQDKARAAYWDGRNEQNEPVASGVYFYTLTAGDFAATRKMLIRK